MATFLKICQDVGRISGTVSGNQPSTVVSQTGRLLKIVNEVNDAWDEIQTSQEYWKWMRRDFTKTIDNPTYEYTPASLGLTDFRIWDRSQKLYMYKTFAGNGAEAPVQFMEWRQFRDIYGFGTIQTGQPSVYTIRPQDDALVFNMIPDVEYTIRGEYMKGNQELTVDGDTPECPVRFHKAVRYLALRNLNTHDEAYSAADRAAIDYGTVFDALTGDQLETTYDASEPIA